MAGVDLDPCTTPTAHTKHPNSQQPTPHSKHPTPNGQQPKVHTKHRRGDEARSTQKYTEADTGTDAAADTNHRERSTPTNGRTYRGSREERCKAFAAGEGLGTYQVCNKAQRLNNNRKPSTRRTDGSRPTLLRIDHSLPLSGVEQGLYIVQVQPSKPKPALDDAHHTPPPPQHELDHTDQEHTSPERFRS